MMKLHSLLALLLVSSLAFVACDSDDDTPKEPEAGTEAGTEAGAEAGSEAGTEAGTEAGSEAGTEAGTEAGSEAGEMVVAPTCEEQCGDFADCAVSSCDGYTEATRPDLYEGCMNLCTDTPALASIYAMYETCEEKIGFAAQAREGFAALCEGGAAQFCQIYSEVCGEWTAETACVEWYDASAEGEEGATEGANRACYNYHLSAAGDGETEEELEANAALHCPHIVGEGAMCVDGEMTGGEMAAGEMAAGEMAAGEATAGEAMAGEAAAGEAMAGEAAAGEATAGESMGGEE